MLKIAFLFLTITHVFHEEYWRDFFKGYESEYSAYVHAKHGTMRNSYFKKYLIPVCIPTSWEYTMQAQIALLKEALKDPDNNKFVFISDSTIPLQDFVTVYKKLMSHPHSQFYTTSNPHIKPGSILYNAERKIPGISVDKQQKHTQWIVLNRDHAQLLVENSHFLKNPVFVDNEHYPGTILALKNKLHEIVPKDITYVNWDAKGRNGKTPFSFSDLSDGNEFGFFLDAIKQGFLFARKFEEHGNLKAADSILPYRKASRSRQELKLEL